MFAAQPITFLKPSRAGSPAALVAPQLGGRRAGRRREVRGRPASTVRAVISSDDKRVGTVPSPVKLDSAGAPPKAVSEGQAIEVRAVVTIRKKMKEKLVERIEEQWNSFIHGIGQGILIQLVSDEVDPETKSGKRSTEAAVRGWLPRPTEQPYIVEYTADLTVPLDFGRPGAILVTNVHSKEVFLMEIVVHGFSRGPIFFPANTWIHSQKDNPSKRIIFSNQAYLPSQTPEGLRDLRQDDLISLRGDGKHERKKHDRIYDYAPYNDLGNPDKSGDLARPVLAGEEKPYPRRCRTGRPSTETDPLSESRIEKPHPVYVPRDEAFEEIKEGTFSAGKIKALLHNLIPLMVAALSGSDKHFTCLSEIDDLYKEGVILNPSEHQAAKKFMLPGILKNIMNIREPLKYDLPSIISRDKFSWLHDSEFARQALAGVNPVNIERLREFPIVSKLDPTIYGPPESAITKDVIENELNGMTVEEAIKQNRLFILDYHDILMPFIKRMNSLKDRKAYASRTVFLSTGTTLKPVVIELSLPSSTSPRRKKVYTHGHDATTQWIWRLAKAHACSNDAGVHQLVNHWGMAVEDATMPYGIMLVLEDYPYAADGLLVWSATKDWVHEYVTHFYPDPNSVSSDIELQAWWDEIKNKGHPDKRNEPWWPNLKTREDLESILTTMIWTASGQHAAVNFGQYPFGGYMPNRPALMKKLIPEEDDPEYEKLLENPLKAFLSSLPTQLKATQLMAVQDTLSTHSPDEEYLGELPQSHSNWINDQRIRTSYEKFSARLEEIEDIIKKRNMDLCLKNRTGAGVPPYELLLRSSGPGATGRGVPNSISI